MTTLICSIPEKLDARLEKLAQQAKVPKNRFVRKALERAVLVRNDDNPHFTLNQPGKRRVKTADELHHEAMKFFGGNRPRVNFTNLIKKLKK